MPTDTRKQRPEADPAAEPKPIPMDDQGPSYSSSYNESTPGEITANRRHALHQQATDDAPATSREKPDADQSNQRQQDGGSDAQGAGEKR